MFTYKAIRRIFFYAYLYHPTQQGVNYFNLLENLLQLLIKTKVSAFKRNFMYWLECVEEKDIKWFPLTKSFVNENNIKLQEKMEKNIQLHFGALKLFSDISREDARWIYVGTEYVQREHNTAQLKLSGIRGPYTFDVTQRTKKYVSRPKSTEILA